MCKYAAEFEKKTGRVVYARDVWKRVQLLNPRSAWSAVMLVALRRPVAVPKVEASHLYELG